MKTINNNNNIESKKNVVVAENEVVIECLTVNGVTRDYPVVQQHGERIGYINTDKGFDGTGIAVNEPHGWRLDHTIQFDFYFNAYIMSRMSLEEVTRAVAASIGIKPGDASVWARDLRTLIGEFVEHYDKFLDCDDDYWDFDADGDPDRLNICMTGIIFDGISLHVDIYDIAEDIKPHTEAEKQEYQAEEAKYLQAVKKRIAELEKIA